MGKAFEGDCKSPFLLPRTASGSRLLARGSFRAIRTTLAAIAAAVALAASGTATAAAAQAVDALEVARRMAASGATDLALQRVNEAQPADPSAPQWIDWELLRLDLLVRRGRDAEVLKRAALVRNIALADRAGALVWLTAARAAQRLGDAVQARELYAMYFLRSHAATMEYRDARLAVINTYLNAGNAEDAYRSMLRFQQDFSPLRPEEIERFVASLIDAGRVSDAVTWLPQLDKASAAAAMLRMRAGLITPDAAIAHARALLAKGGSDSALELLAGAALAQKNRAVEIEALEHRLNAPAMASRDLLARHAADLWTAYGEVGQQTANQLQLLVGDEAAWIERAIRMHAQQPQIARSLLGHIGAASRAEESRSRAHVQLIGFLRDAKLGHAALRLFADPKRFPVQALQPAVRLELGSLAFDLRNHAEAVRFWQGMPQPPGASSTEWRLRYVAALFAAGMLDQGLEAAKSMIAGPPALPSESLGRMIAIAADALESWQVKAAESLFALLLPATTGAQRIQVLLGLAKSRELRGEFRAAADAYLNAAVMYGAPEVEREALRARESGAVNLARAGMLDDARATYQWLASHAKDAAVRDNAARVLKNF